MQADNPYQVLRLLELCAAQIDLGVRPSSNPLVLFAAAIAWSALWGQMVVIHFFRKSEEMYKDYHASGAMNTAKAAIEANQLVPALVAMFDKALDARPDGRRRPDMSELLQTVEFVPDFRAAQEAMAHIEELQQYYELLKVKAGRLWIWALSHAVITPLVVAVYVFVPTDNYSYCPLCVISAAWIATLAITIIGYSRFHKLMTRFNRNLELHGGNNQ